jgi:GNAT superfamily N-acetyltransferase
MAIEIRQAEIEDAEHVSSVLTEAAKWLDSIGQSLWQCDELAAARIADDVRAGLYFITWMDGDAVGTLRFQLEDSLFWPDVPPNSSAFAHRVAVKRRVAGKDVAAHMLNWAKDRPQTIGRKFLRLDCALRPKLCAFYERNGFTKHSERQVGPYLVARYECDTDRKTFRPVGHFGAMNTLSGGNCATSDAGWPKLLASTSTGFPAIHCDKSTAS